MKYKVCKSKHVYLDIFQKKSYRKTDLVIVMDTALHQSGKCLIQETCFLPLQLLSKTFFTLDISGLRLDFGLYIGISFTKNTIQELHTR